MIQEGGCGCSSNRTEDCDECDSRQCLWEMRECEWVDGLGQGEGVDG